MTSLHYRSTAARFNRRPETSGATALVLPFVAVLVLAAVLAALQLTYLDRLTIISRRV